MTKNNLGWLMLLPKPIKRGRGEGEEKEDFNTRLSDAIALGEGELLLLPVYNCRTQETRKRTPAVQGLEIKCAWS